MMWAKSYMMKAQKIHFEILASRLAESGAESNNSKKNLALLR